MWLVESHDEYGWAPEGLFGRKAHADRMAAGLRAGPADESVRVRGLTAEEAAAEIPAECWPEDAFTD